MHYILLRWRTHAVAQQRDLTIHTRKSSVETTLPRYRTTYGELEAARALHDVRASDAAAVL